MKKQNVEKAVYPGNMGFAEMYNMVRNAPPEVGSRFLDLIRVDKYREAIKMMEDFHSIKFDPSIYGKQIWMQGGHTAHRRAQRLERNQAIREQNKKKIEQPKKFFLTGEVMSGVKKADVTKGKRMKHIIIQKANVDGYYREKDGKQQFVKSHIRHVVTTERLGDSDLQKSHKIFVPGGQRKVKKAFRLVSYAHTLGKEESRRSKREKAQSGDWTPHEQRFRERAKQRREDYSGGEG